ncbi:MAG: DUF4411 family protein [Flavobacteriaceae bacterium]|nr:DUF4411 family protein [Flavobacteriaceae bacterium]
MKICKNIFLLDSDVLIAAKKRYYPFDVCPGFWEALIQHHKLKHIYSIDRVKKEIYDYQYPDNLSLWVRDNLTNDFFNPPKR